MEYHGLIDPIEITNENPPAPDLAGFTPMYEQNIRFVHYPDCQQLIIWLPSHGQEYTTYSFCQTDGPFSEEGDIGNILNGSIQLLWDTAKRCPGTYQLSINHRSGGRHLIWFTKQQAGWIPEKKETPQQTDPGPVVYRDGFGKELEDEDLVLRKAVTAKMLKTFTRQVSYEGNVRSGYVIYRDNEHVARFYSEMGGGDCLFYINIPAGGKWEAETKIPLAERAEIIGFVAATVKAQQAPGSTVEITENAINFYQS